MKKKLIVMILIVAMLPAMIFAGDMLQLGLNVGYKPTLASLMETKADVKDYFKMEYFTFAPEVKLNLFFVDVDATAFFSFTDKTIEIDTQLGADLFVKLFGTLRLSAGAGINMPFAYDKENSEWKIWDQKVSDISFGDQFMNSFLAYRAGVGLHFDSVDVMVNYSVPTTGTFSKPDFNPDWDRGQFSLGLLFNLL